MEAEEQYIKPMSFCEGCPVRWKKEPLTEEELECVCDFCPEYPEGSIKELKELKTEVKEDKFKERLSEEPKKVIEEERKHDRNIIEMVRDLRESLKRQNKKLKEVRELIEEGGRILDVKGDES